MAYEWFIAGRYLQAVRRRGFVSFITGFAIIGIAIGTAAVIIALSILAGFEKEIKEKVFGFITHIQVVGFQGQPLENYESNMARIKSEVSGVRGIAPVVAREAMIRASDRVDGVVLHGIDPSRDISRIRDYLIEGSFLQHSDSEPQILIGAKLARSLSIALGGRVVLFALNPGAATSAPRAKAFQVVGIFESGMAEYDDMYVYTNLKDAQHLFRLDDVVLAYDILVNDLDSASIIAASIQKLLGYPHHGRTAPQLYRNLFAWIELQKKPAPIILGLIILVAAVNVIGTLLMLVLEKTVDIGVLRSLGARKKSIRRLFHLQAVFIAGVGVGLGNILALGLCWAQLEYRLFRLPSDIYYMTTVPILLIPTNFLIVTLVVCTVCMIAASIPARAASRLDPIASIRFR